MAYWRLHYHLVWATYKREPMIDSERERIIFGTVYRKAQELGLIIHAAGGVEDHIHIVASIPPRLSVADCIRHFNGASSHVVNHTARSDSVFRWQEGYGAITIGERSLPTVINYVNSQKEHHATGITTAIYEQLSEEDDGPIIESA